MFTATDLTLIPVFLYWFWDKRKGLYMLAFYYAERIVSDGENIQKVCVFASHTRPCDRNTASFAFPGKKRTRALVADITGNSAFGMPMFLKA